MGLFSSKKKTYVSSQVYSLAGDYKERQNYKKANIFSIINTSSEGGDFGEHLFSTINASQLSAYRRFNIMSHKIDYWGATSQHKPLIELPSVTYDLSIKKLLEEYLESEVYIYDVDSKLWDLRNELVRHFYEDSYKIVVLSNLSKERVFNHLDNICADNTNYYEEDNISIKEEYEIRFEPRTIGVVGDKAVYPDNVRITLGSSLPNANTDYQGRLVVSLVKINQDTNEVVKREYLFSTQNRKYGEVLPLKYNKIVQEGKVNTKATIAFENPLKDKDSIAIYYRRVTRFTPEDYYPEESIETKPLSFDLNDYHILSQEKSSLDSSQEVLIEYYFKEDEFYIKDEEGNFIPYDNVKIKGNTIKVISKDSNLPLNPFTNIYELNNRNDLIKPLRIKVEPIKVIKLKLSDSVDGSELRGKYLNDEYTDKGYIQLTKTVDEVIYVKPTHYKTKNEDYQYKVIKYRNYVEGSPLFEEGPMEHIFYTKGTGNPSLDEIIDSNQRISTDFAPIMPIRLYKTNVIDDNYNNFSDKNKRLFNILTRSNQYPKLIENINSSDGIGDIENAYIIQGIPITTQDDICKEYLWTFFSEISGHSIGANTVDFIKDNEILLNEVLKGNYFKYSSEKGGLYLMNNGRLKYLSWTDMHFGHYDGYPLAKYAIINDPFSENKRQSVNIQMGSMYGIATILTLNIRSIGVRKGDGEYKGMKENEIKLFGDSLKVPYAILVEQYESDSFYVGSVPSIIYDNYEMLSLVKKTRGGYEIIDLLSPSYDNEVKPGYWTGVHGKDVFNYGSEECPMIIPLNNTLLNRMPVLNAVQVAANCSHIVFNTWKVVKQKWYQTGIFKVVLVVAAVVVSIYFPPFGAAAGGTGILGANLAVGMAMGLAGTAAIIGGAIANAVAAVVVSHIISKAVDKIFDGTLAIIVKMIASYAVAQIGSETSFMDSIKDSFDNFLDISNIIKGTDYIASIYQNNKMGKIQARQEDFINTMNEFQSKAEEMKKNMEELGFENSNFELANIYIDSKTQIPNEAPEDFLARTLLTGSDIIEQSLRMIDSYVEIQLEQKEV